MAKKAQLHPGFQGIVAIRAGGPVPTSLSRNPKDTANQDAEEQARNLVACQFAPADHPLGNLAAAEDAARLLIADLEQDREAGLFGGEAVGTYGTHHFLAREISLTAVLDLRGRYPESAVLVEAHRHLLGWWNAAGSFVLAIRGPSGVCLDPWSRRKDASVLEPGSWGGPRGCETVAQHLAPRTSPHPDLVKRWREPLSSDWYGNRPHDALLRSELEGPTGEHLKLVFQRGPIGRLRDLTHWWDAGPGFRVLCETVKVLRDTDSRAVVHDPLITWDGDAGVYHQETGPHKGPKGASVCWEIEEVSGHLFTTWLRGIQGARQHEALPHPGGERAANYAWDGSAGPDSVPYPLPVADELGGGTTIDPPPPEPEPIPEEPTPEHPEEEGPESRPGTPTPEQIERAREKIREVKRNTKSGITGRQALLVRQTLQDVLALLAGREPK